MMCQPLIVAVKLRFTTHPDSRGSLSNITLFKEYKHTKEIQHTNNLMKLAAMHLVHN